jgi:hypothetical protein
MYGLGIRLGYYLQWYGNIFASLLAPQEVPNARFALGLFISATFLALVINTVQDDLYAVEIYIILLLTFGAYLFLVPQLLWRLVTGCQPLLDPSRFQTVDPGPTYRDLQTILILAVTSYQLWFWFVKIPDLDRWDCEQYGFAFYKVRLNNRAFQVINIVLYFILGVAVLVLFTIRISSMFKDSGDGVRRDEQWEREKERLGKRRLSLRVDALRKLNLVSNLITATFVVVATELTIEWNHAQAVNTLSSAGQLIPFVIGLGVIVRVLYVWLKSGPIDPHLLPGLNIVPNESTNGRPILTPPPGYTIPPIMASLPRARRPSRPEPGPKSRASRLDRQHQASAPRATAQSSTRTFFRVSRPPTLYPYGGSPVSGQSRQPQDPPMHRSPSSRRRTIPGDPFRPPPTFVMDPESSGASKKRQDRGSYR